MEAKRYLRRPAVIEKTGLGATTIYKLEKSGDFPQHFLITPRCAVWDESEIEAWLASRRGQVKPAKGLPDVTRRKRVGHRGSVRNEREAAA